MVVTAMNSGSPNSSGLTAEIGVSVGDPTESFTLDLTLEIDPGTTVAMLGPNGAGKSTTVSAIAGVTPIDRGSIVLRSRTLDSPATNTFVAPEDRNIGVVFQDYLLFGHLSVAENAAFGPRGKGLGRRESRTLANRWLSELGLGELAERKPAELSGGQAQRVALARALATNPDLLLLDEPLAALDIATRTSLRRTLAEYLETFQGPRLLITHDPQDAFALADQILVIENGTLTQRGSAEEVRRRPATPYVAALAGTNLLTGTNRDGVITINSHSESKSESNSEASSDSGFELRTSERFNGPVQAVVAPRAISLHHERPQGSPRNTWQSTIDWIEPLGETTRVQLGQPLPVMVDITPAAAEALALAPAAPVWAAVKATEVAVTAL